MDFLDSIGYNIVAISAILMPVLLVLVVLFFAYRKTHERNRLIEKMLEKGEDSDTIVALLDGNNKKDDKSPAKHFKSGITLVSVGLGMMVMGWISGWNIVAVGALIAIIGLGELAVAWYLRKYSK